MGTPCVLEEHKYARVKIKHGTETQCLMCTWPASPEQARVNLVGGTGPIVSPVVHNEHSRYNIREAVCPDITESIPSDIPF